MMFKADKFEVRYKIDKLVHAPQCGWCGRTPRHSIVKSTDRNYLNRVKKSLISRGWRMTKNLIRNRSINICSGCYAQGIVPYNMNVDLDLLNSTGQIKMSAVYDVALFCRIKDCGISLQNRRTWYKPNKKTIEKMATNYIGTFWYSRVGKSVYKKMQRNRESKFRCCICYAHGVSIIGEEFSTKVRSSPWD